jgi:hypothetical protein
MSSDLNGDGVVDGRDLKIFAEEFGGETDFYGGSEYTR